MTEAILFPDVEDVVATWLGPQLAAAGFPVPVGTRVPNPRPTEFVRLLATGGQRLNLVQGAPTLTVEAWAELETRASLLCRTALALIESMAGQVIDGVTVYRANDFGLPVNLPDPASAQVRYTSTGSIVLRGSAL